MNFQQLRIMRETVKCRFNLTEVASAVYTSQSGVSKHIKDLEDELGIELFIRKGKRLLGLTEPGSEVVAIAERILTDAKNIQRLAQHFSAREEGQLTVATTHTQARYVLPQVISEFKKAFPRVHLKLHQGSPDEIASMLRNGDADIGVATEALANVSDIVSFPYYAWHHAVVVPKGHPLEQVRPLTLEAVAAHPIITYHDGFTGRTKIDQTFARAGLRPDIVMSALDTDVIKSYVELGLGVGIIAIMAYNPERDTTLTLLDSENLFEEIVTRIAVRHGRYLRGFAYRFIELCSPRLSEGIVRSAIQLPQDSEA